MEYLNWHWVRRIAVLSLALVATGSRSTAQCGTETLYNCPPAMDFVDVTMVTHAPLLTQGTVASVVSIQFNANWTPLGFFAVGLSETCVQLPGFATLSGAPLSLGVTPNFMVSPTIVHETGAMQLDFVVPSSAALAGTKLYFQAFQFNSCATCSPVKLWWNTSLVAVSTIC